MVFSIAEEYDKIWKKADELAEQETAQYELHPYTHVVQVEKADGSVVVSHRKYARGEYKDDKRQHHLLDMLSVLMGSETLEVK
jgi:hypothetical protein